MFYFDASYLVPLIRRETLSDRVEGFLATIVGEHLVTSHWALVECRSVLAREVRMGRMPMARFQSCGKQLDELVARSFELIVPLEDDYRRAAALLELPESGLRAGDSLHLALAGRLGAGLLLSLDLKLIAIGRSNGIPVGMGFDQA